MRIDTHAHAFPGLGYHARGLPAPVRAGVSGAVAVLERLARRSAGRTARLDVEWLAAFRRRGGAAFHSALELVGGLAMLPQVALRSSLDDLVASMDRHLITRTVVIAGTPSAPNDWLLDAAPLCDGRVIPVAHPVTDTGDFEAAYDALAERGAAGFKIHHNMDGLPPDAPTYRAMFEVARARDLFIIVHTGCFHVIGYKHQRPASPELFSDLFAEYPDVRVCLAHMNRDDPEAAWEIMRRFENVYVDTSWQTTESVRRAMAAIGPERVLLGSDWPLLHADLQGDCLQIVQRACSDAEVEMVVDVAPRRFIG